MMSMVASTVTAGEQQAGPSPMPTSMMTMLGMVEGEILSDLEQYGTLTLRRLIRMVEWPTMMVVMGVGALIREGLVRAVRRELEVILEPVKPGSAIP